MVEYLVEYKEPVPEYLVITKISELIESRGGIFYQMGWYKDGKASTGFYRTSEELSRGESPLVSMVVLKEELDLLSETTLRGDSGLIKYRVISDVLSQEAIESLRNLKPNRQE